MGLVSGARFSNEVQGKICEFLSGVSLFLSESVKKDLLPLWEQSVANSGGYFYHTKHLSCPRESFEPFFEVYQRTALVTAMGPQVNKVIWQHLDEPNDSVVTEEL